MIWAYKHRFELFLYEQLDKSFCRQSLLVPESVVGDLFDPDGKLSIFTLRLNPPSASGERGWIREAAYNDTLEQDLTISWVEG
jgi:hypothetical protein